MTAATMPPIPCMDGLPTVVVDAREQWPLPIRQLPFVRGGLYSGDYSIAGLETLFSIERKSIDDLTGCCTNANRERFSNELHRLRGFWFKRLLIVGDKSDVLAGNYRSKVKPASVMGSLAAWEVRYDCPVVWADTPEAAAGMVEAWAWYFTRELAKSFKELSRHTATGKQEDD